MEAECAAPKSSRDRVQMRDKAGDRVGNKGETKRETKRAAQKSFRDRMHMGDTVGDKAGFMS